MLPSLIFALLLQAIAQQPQSEPRRAAEIHGRVTDKETGQPLARATVRLHSTDGRERFATHTDDAGLFRFTGLPPGEYSGIVDAGEFRATHQMTSLVSLPGPRSTIALKEGERREVNVALTRTFAIAVRVVDEWGEPLSGLGVTAQAADSGRPVQMSWNRTTDDHGRLRVFGLPRGSYVLCAQVQFFASVRPATADRQPGGFLRTCFPSAPDEVDAQPVRIDGSDAGEIEIRMRRGRTFTISGRVVDASGAPAAAPMVSLVKFITNGSMGVGMGVDSEGRFAMANVQPGDFAIEATLGGLYQPDQRRPLEAAFVPIRIDAADVEDLLVQLRRTVDVTGRVTLEDPNARLPPVAGSGLMVRARLAGDRLPGTGSTGHALVEEDKQFTLTGLFGRRTLDVVNVPRGWYVKSIRYGSKEIADEPIEFKDGSDAPALEVLLSSRGAVVTGCAVDDLGDPVPRATILLLSDDGTGTGFRTAATTTATAQGTFKIGPVRRGDYRIVAAPASASPLQEGEWQRAARLAASAERITLGELDERLIDLRVVK